MTRKLIILAILFLVSVNGFAQSYSRVNPDSIPFAPAVNFPAGDGPYSVFCADLDGDLDLDLAVANIGGNVSILKNNGDGTFQTAVNYGTGIYSYSVFCADLDGDFDLDLAVANYASNNVSALKNNGDGTFQTAVNYGAGAPPSVFCADLDGDSDLDLAVANALYNNVSILKNNGDGTFQTEVNYGTGPGPWSIFCADLDGDGDLDLAVANNSYNSSSNVSILKNNGDGTFQTAVNYSTGIYSYSVFCADLDGDSDLDLAVANNGSNNVSILKNNGDGTFQTAVNYGAGSYPYSVFCTDLDGDSHLDLAVANAESHNVSILKNNGDGTFQTTVNYGAGGSPRSVFCGDLDGDGDLDLVVANNWTNNVSILFNLSNLARPDSFSLIFPANTDSVKTPVILKWQKAIDPDPNDTVRYHLYLSRSVVFNPDSTIVYDSLLDTTFTDSLDIKTWHWKVKAYDKWVATRWSDQSWIFYVYVCGNCNGDSLGQITVGDVVYLINYLFKGGPAPVPLKAGDVNCDLKETVSDVVYLINYLFKGGPKPCEPSQNLVAYYPFNGNANDESGKGNNGTVNGASPTNDRFGKTDAAYFFNMSDITIPASNSLNFSNSFTVSVWSNKIGTDAARGSLVATGGSSCAKGFLVQHRENGVRLEVSDGDGWDCIVMINTNSNTENDKWHHFVFVVDGILNKANAYVDGDRVIINQDISGETNISDPNIPLRIGRLNSTGDPQYFNGSIDDIRIYKRALTDNEIQALYHEGGW